MQLELDVEGWPAGEWEALASRAARAAGEVEPLLARPRLQVSVLLTGDDEVHALNREWRGRDKATNVLSFPMLTREELAAIGGGGPPVLLGDVAMAAGVCAHEAKAKGIAIEDHAAHLLIHGLFHLAGRDHVNSDAEADAMEALETRALAKLGIADPYGTSN